MQTKLPMTDTVDLALGALGLAAAKPAFAATPTPSATDGSFYPTPTMRRADVDNDLVKILGSVYGLWNGRRCRAGCCGCSRVIAKTGAFPKNCTQKHSA